MSMELTNEEKLTIAKQVLDADEFNTYNELLEKNEKHKLGALDSTEFRTLSFQLKKHFEEFQTEQANTDKGDYLDGLPLQETFLISKMEKVTAKLVKIPHSQIQELTEVDIIFNGRDQELMSHGQYLELLERMKTYHAQGQRAQDKPAIGFRVPGTTKIIVVDGSTRRIGCIEGGFDYYIYVIERTLNVNHCDFINEGINQKPKSLLDHGARYSAQWERALQASKDLSQEAFAQSIGMSVKSVFNLIKASEVRSELRFLAAQQATLTTRDVQALINLNTAFKDLDNRNLKKKIDELSEDFEESNDISLFQHIIKKSKTKARTENKPEVIWMSGDGKAKAVKSPTGQVTIKGFNQDSVSQLAELLSKHFSSLE